MTKQKEVGVYWKNVHTYNAKEEMDNPTPAYTEGTLEKDEDLYIIIKNPETLIFLKDGVYNHPQEKPWYYFIPRALIEKVVYYD